MLINSPTCNKLNTIICHQAPGASDLAKARNNALRESKKNKATNVIKNNTILLINMLSSPKSPITTSSINGIAPIIASAIYTAINISMMRSLPKVKPYTNADTTKNRIINKSQVGF